MVRPPHLMSMADLSTTQIKRLLLHARYLKQASLDSLPPRSFQRSLPSPVPMPMPGKPVMRRMNLDKSLKDMTIALLFSKRSTRTRVAAETAAGLLGGQAIFLGRDDIQLGVNESARDTSRVLSGMCQGIFARVGAHEEVEVCHIGNTTELYGGTNASQGTCTVL